MTRAGAIIRIRVLIKNTREALDKLEIELQNLINIEAKK